MKSYDLLLFSVSLGADRPLFHNRGAQPQAKEGSCRLFVVSSIHFLRVDSADMRFNIDERRAGNRCKICLLQRRMFSFDARRPISEVMQRLDCQVNRDAGNER